MAASGSAPICVYVYAAPCNADVAAKQAAYILYLLRKYETMETPKNRHWPQAFWCQVAQLEADTTLHPRILAIIKHYGYIGGGTMQFPGEHFRAQLALVVDPGFVPTHIIPHATVEWSEPYGPTSQLALEDAHPPAR